VTSCIIQSPRKSLSCAIVQPRVFMMFVNGSALRELEVQMSFTAW
jgi:hypothetical protein